MFFSGGTWDILGVDLLDKLFSNLSKLIDNDTYIIMEVHPGFTKREILELYRKNGSKRIMVGVQTLNDNVLKFFHRTGNKKQTMYILNLIKELGFSVLDIDLIAGLKGETIKTFLVNLKELVNEISPDIIHIYPFTPYKTIPFVKLGYVYSDKDILVREKILKLSRLYLLSTGYRIGDGFIKKGINDISIWSRDIKEDTYIFSFGYPLDVLGKIPGYGVYTTDIRGGFYSYIFDGFDEVAYYLFRKISYGQRIDVEYLKVKFGIDFYKEYNDVILFLSNLSFVDLKITPYFIDINVSNTVYRLVIRWAFSSLKVLSLFLEKKRNKFDYNYNYFSDFIRRFGMNYI